MSLDIRHMRHICPKYYVTRIFSYKKRSERVRAKSFLRISDMLGLKVSSQFLNFKCDSFKE